jgi:flagellin-like protein
VSPIIATILLVAITVVLAAVLYILISGLTGTSSSKPFSLGFGQGNPSQNTSTTTRYFDEFPVSPSSGLTTGIFAAKILTPTGTGIAVGTVPAGNCGTTPVSGTLFPACAAPSAGAWYVLLANQNGGLLASYDGTGWHLPAGVTSQAVSSAMEFIVVSTSVYAGSANTLAVYGTGQSSVSGQTTM